MELKKIQYEADLLSALAQPTRLRILYLLREGERCVCEINPSMPEDNSVISRHLSKLRDAGILESRREGVSVYYRIKDDSVFRILEIVDEIAAAAFMEKAQEFIETS
ncbi:winged helix-turn-helix transcriptional regulator [bacterium]|nr:winged helix-turn-helix transcriptional regulator [bacterium]